MISVTAGHFLVYVCGLIYNKLMRSVLLLLASSMMIDSNFLFIFLQLESARGDAMNAVDQYREAERELQVIRQRCNEQSDQLVQKSGTFYQLLCRVVHTLCCDI